MKKSIIFLSLFLLTTPILFGQKTRSISINVGRTVEIIRDIIPFIDQTSILYPPRPPKTGVVSVPQIQPCIKSSPHEVYEICVVAHTPTYKPQDKVDLCLDYRTYSKGAVTGALITGSLGAISGYYLTNTFDSSLISTKNITKSRNKNALITAAISGLLGSIFGATIERKIKKGYYNKTRKTSYQVF